jgi:hypothetical protein
VARAIIGRGLMLVERRIDMVGLGVVALRAQTRGEQAGAGGRGSLIVAHSRIIR